MKEKARNIETNNSWSYKTMLLILVFDYYMDPKARVLWVPMLDLTGGN